MRNRQYTARETRWVAEYVQLTYPTVFDEGRYMFQVPLGPLSEGYSARLAPRVDAIVFGAGATHLIEGDIEKPMSALGDLIHYRDLFSQTKRFADMLTNELVAVLLIPNVDSNVILQAEKQGVEVKTFRPQWLLEYMIERRGRQKLHG